jgi:hypothetical protein
MNREPGPVGRGPERRPRFGLPARGPLAGPWSRLETGDPETRVRAAWMIAVAADLLQIALMPLFVGGVVSPANDVVDVVVAFLMWRLLGWHFAFLPTFLVELVPGVSLIPTWTAAVWLATRGRRGAARGAPRPEPRGEDDAARPAGRD